MNLPYEACKFLFLPDTPKGTLKVQPGQGVCYQHHWYWSDEMLQPKVEHSSVAAKYDPYDLTKLYLYINGSWVEAEVRSGPLREILHTLTEWERRYASREMTGLTRLYRGTKQRKKVQAAYGAYARKMREQEQMLKAKLKSEANLENEKRRRSATGSPELQLETDETSEPHAPRQRVTREDIQHPKRETY